MTFGRQHTGLGRGSGPRGSERDRRLFIAAAVLAMSLLLVLAVVFKFKVSQASQDQPAANTQMDESSMATVTLLAPERPVKAGTKLSEVRFRTMYWPRNQVPEGAIRDLAEISGKFARVALASGVPIERGQLTDRPALSVLALTKGNRAVTITVDAETSIEYHVLPGTSVDVVLTHYIGRDVQSKVIVQNARVLSLGGSTEQRGKNRAKLQSKTVTLDVSPQDALQIVAGKQLGKLSLLLRDQGDEAPIPVEEMDAAEVTDANRDQKKANPSSRGCVGGRVKIEGNEFLVSCDGTIYRDAGDLEP